MKNTLLEYLRCPICLTQLQITHHVAKDDIVEAGTLTCQNMHLFQIENSIPQMLSPETPGYKEKMREVQGWVAMSQAQGWYIPTPEIDLALPDVVSKLGWDPVDASSWVGTQHSFHQMFAKVVKPGMRVLEVGAAKAWSGRFFVQAGCEYTACDIMADPNIGLGRAKFFMEQSGCFYEVVAADAERLPFASGVFDLVFAIAALHHALDLNQMVKEMARVAKRGAIVAGLAEGVRGLSASPDAEIQATEKTYGINEHVYTLNDYCRAFFFNKLWVTTIQRAAGTEWFMPNDRKVQFQRLSAIPLIGEWLAMKRLLDLHVYDGVTLYGVKLF